MTAAETDLRPVLVGESNPYGGDPRFDLYHLPLSSAGGRLCRVVLGLLPREYLARFRRVNLLRGKWSIPAARKAASELVEELLGRGGPPLILLGGRVAEAFGLRFEPFCSRPAGQVSGGAWRCAYAVLPHPSGRNRMWNVPGAVHQARAAVRRAVLDEDLPARERCLAGTCDCDVFPRPPSRRLDLAGFDRGDDGGFRQ